MERDEKMGVKGMIKHTWTIRKGLTMLAVAMLLMGGEVHATQATETPVTEATTQTVTAKPTTTETATTETISATKESVKEDKPGTPVVQGEYVKKKVQLTWKAVDKAQTYYIFKKNADGQYVKIAETNKTSYKDKSVKKGNDYYYKVRAVYQGADKLIKGNRSKVCKVSVDNIDPNKKMVALTFDDGPGKYTKTIVDCLKKNDAKATFFVVGTSLASYPDAVKYADKAGCEIGSHTYDHKDLARLSADEVKKEVSSTDQKLKKLIGKNAALMRPPYGSIGDTVKKNVGKPMILWSIDTLDWKTRDTQKTIDAVMKDVKDGDIVLMHDIHEPTKNAALQIIPRLKKQGYQLVTVSELAKYRGYKLEKGVAYRTMYKKKK
ncbi:MAG: polysaccharide deacetylase family protein [Lachnospiraceae bacterium]|nr:polysaccharide deacetylase family protein [Lachnospiraceae bacterium]